MTTLWDSQGINECVCGRGGGVRGGGGIEGEFKEEKAKEVLNCLPSP